MEILITALASVLVTAIPAWLLHRESVKKEKTTSEVAAAAIHAALDERMQKHVDFVEKRMEREREWFKDELEREREECAESIGNLAGRLGIAEANLRKLRGVEGPGGKSGLPTP